MTVYPYEFDDDQTLIRIDDNITELGGQAINQLRDAVFAIQRVLGLNPEGASGSLADRIARSLDADGDVKASALTSVGLATLPIVDNQVANTAGIKEIKLALDHSTSDLYTLILANKALLDSLSGFTATLGANLTVHIGGGSILLDGSPARHVASHIDINNVPSDSRDVTFTWSGLRDKDGVLRTASNVAEALLQINDDLTGHENTTADAHPATAITVDTTNFTEIPVEADTVQKALDAIDNSDRLQIGEHRSTMHYNGIPRAARTEQIGLDGYSDNIVPATPIRAFLVNPPASAPVDSNSQGDDVIQFLPTSDADFKFDEKFTQVKVGDIVTINYGNGIEAQFPVESIRFSPAVEWFVRINGVNLFNTDGYTAYARIDRPAFNTNTYGVLAVAAANNDIDATLLGSVVVGHPRGATALGIDFDPNQLSSAHYKLYLQLYPSGDPTEKIINLPAIDVTGDAGASPGQYTLSRVVASTNDAFRAAGYNYRFIAFEHEGNFGIMLADPIGKASFSITNGIVSGSSLAESTYTFNVVGDATDGEDALGFGAAKAALASPTYNSSFSSAEAATNLPTRIITPLRHRNFAVNGVRQDVFAPTFKANSEGYWPATITARTPIGTTTVEVSYTVDMDLCEAGLKPGKTIVVQPTVGFTDASYTNTDYGRFIIKSVAFTAPCDTTPATTVITVVNGLHATGSPTGASSEAGLAVKLFFGADSVGFNAVNMIDAAPTGTTYNRFHEIYIADGGNTFSHERARMPKQASSATLLGTSTNWTVRDVSSKLRGWRDDSSSALNKYIRFYVLSYNSTTGEYDGYIGKRVVGGPGVTKYGAVTRARKNLPARFYDETNIDYIELEFFDTSASTGIDVMPSNSPRYVDIELFQTLREDEEFFYIASVEVDDKYIDTVTDRRQFGNVNEKNLSTSAIQFIESGDRYLHANGVIRGFDYVGVDPSNDNRLQFEGGLALVNGHISTVNAGSVAIPQIIPDGTTVPQSLQWAVCVNDKNEFVAFLLTATKEQFFAQTPGGGTNYYVPSTTFVDLVANRKDLVPIYVADITIASFTVNTMSDARRFAANETDNIPLTWIPAIANGDGATKLIGHFNSFDAVKTWINNYGSANNTVKVRGTFTVSSSIDMSGLTQPVTFEGENATFNVTAAKGILLGSNITIRGITFNYNPTGLSYTAGDVVNVGNACLYTGSGISNVIIEKCLFDTANTAQIPPFINFHATSQLTWSNITIRENRFTTDAALTISQAAIAITNNVTTGTLPTIAHNLKIEDNTCQSNHGIYVTSTISAGQGLAVTNGRVFRNNCGSIGAIVSGVDGLVDYVRFDLDISENSCSFIATLDLEGDFISGFFYTYSTGYVSVTNNKCNWIWMACVLDSASGEHGATLILDNKLTGNDVTFINTNHNTGTSSNAIVVHGGLTFTAGVATISKNTVAVGKVNGTSYTYSATGISLSSCRAIVTNNSITGASGASCNILFITSVGSATITGNQLNRSGNTVNSYINGSSATGSGLVVDNIFDSHTIDGSSTTLVTGAPTSWVIERNKNQTVSITVKPISGAHTHYHDVTAATNALFGTGSIPTDLLQVAITTTSSGAGTASLAYVGTGQHVQWDWLLSAYDVLPTNVNIVSVSVTVQSNIQVPSGGGNVANTVFRLASDSIAHLTATGSYIDPYVANSSIVLTLPVGSSASSSNSNFYVTPTHNPFIAVSTTLDHGAGAQVVQASSITVIYRW